MGLMKKLTSAVVASSLVLGAASTAFAAPAAEEVNAAYARLNHYSIVQGVAQADGTVTPALEKNITRAELITIIVRAFGQEANAKLLRGAKTGYADVDGNADVDWATGYIFMGQRIAAEKGITIGLPDAKFAPQAEVSQVEALGLVMKFLGVAAGTGENWAADTVANAKAAGIITDADAAKYLDNLSASANRGHVFGLLDGIFAQYNKVEGGKTVYTAYVDTQKPVLTVAQPAVTTDKAAITVTGSVKGEFSALYVGSEKIAANEDGTFSAEVALNVGANTIAVTAVDLAGNTDEATYTVTRTAGAAAKVTASLASSVVAGSAADLTYEITDANGVAIEVAAADVTVTVAGNVGTYADGKFTASEKAGVGTVTVAYGTLTPVTLDVTVVAGPLAKVQADKTSAAKGETVQLTATDVYGNAIASGVTYTWTGSGIAVTGNGLVYTAEAGKYTVTAKAGEATATATIGVYADEVASIKVSAPETITANGETRKAVTIAAADEFGNTVGSYEKKVDLSGAGVTFYDKAKDGNVITDVTTEDGVATVYVAVDAALAGEAVVIKAVANDNSKIKGEGSFEAAAAVATSVKVTSAPKFMAANEYSEAEIAVAVVDQEGVEMDDVYTVNATVTGPATLVDETATYTNGTDAEFTINNAEAIGTEGTITVTFDVEGVGTTTAVVKQVVAGNPAKLGLSVEKSSLSADKGTFEFTVEVQDRNGVPVALSADAADLTVTLPKAVKKAFKVDDAATNADGEATVTLAAGAKTATFEVKVVDKFTGNLNVGVSTKLTVNGKTTTMAGNSTVSVTPGEITQVLLDRADETVNVSVSNPKATFSASLADQFGNSVAKSGVELTMYAQDGAASTKNVTLNGKAASAASPITVKTDAEGKVALDVVARPYADVSYTVGVNYEATGSTTTLKVVNAIVSSVSTKLYKEVNGQFTTATSVKAGETFYVVATVTDNYGGPVTGIASDLKVVAPKDTLAKNLTGDLYTEDEVKTLEFTTTDPGIGLEDGQYVVELTAGKAGVVAVGAKYADLQSPISKTSNISVKAGALEALTVNGDKEIEVTGAGKVHGAYTVSLSDVFGNTVAQNTNAKIEITSDGGGKLTFRQTEGGVTVSEISTKSTANFYFVATETGTYSVTFSVGGVSETFDIVVK